MGTQKSQGTEDLNRFILCLYENLLADLAQHFPEEKNTLERDFETIKSRIASEGLSFVTKVLPRLGKSFDAALDSGFFEAPLGFSKAKGSRAIPAFLQGMLKKCFTLDGFLATPDASVVRDIRQVCYLVYKMQIPYTPSQEKAVIDNFLATENEVASLVIHRDRVLERASMLLAEVFRGFDPKDILPKHGPGAVATGEKLEEKWEFSRLYSGIHQKYPYYDYFVVGGSREILDRVKWYRSLDRSESCGVAKVVLVPKDSRGPRLISCEPLEYQWIQQGLNRSLVKRLENHPLTSGRVNFSDQTINQELALSSSKNHFYATIDLRDASDRVTVKLVEELFPQGMVPYLLAVRSGSTLLPDGRTVSLAKYAPMGSATCFSVEAACFWAVCVSSVSEALSVNYREAASFVYVYGDDIVIPCMAFESVVEALRRVGLMVNESKSFYRGDFRESCGVDAYNGVDVTPTRVSRLWSGRSSDGEALSSFTSYANQFAKKGYDELARFLFAALDSVHRVIPFGLVSSGYPNRNCDLVSDALRENSRRGIPIKYCKSLQRWKAKVPYLQSGRRTTTLDGWGRLLKDLTQGPGESPSEVVLPRSTKLRYGWRYI